MSTGFDLDATDVKEFDDVELGGNWLVPGLYHVMVKAAEEVASKEGTPGMKFHLEALAGTVPGQESHEVAESFWLSQKAIPRLKKFALASRALREGEKKPADALLTDAIGCQLVVEVKERTYKKQDGSDGKASELAYDGFWPLSHKDVAAVPKCKEALAMLGPDGRPKAEAQAAVAAAAGGGSDDEWGNI